MNAIKSVLRRISFGAALLLVSIYSAHAQTNEIRVGVLLALSGPAAYLGTPVQQSLQLLVDHYNADGGIAGRKLVLVTYDTEGNTGKAVQLFRRLVESDMVQVVIGPSTTGESLAIGPIAEELKVPMISFGAGRDIVLPVKQNSFKVPPTDEIEIRQLLRDFARRGIRKIGVIATAGPYGQSAEALLKRYAPTAGIDIVAFEEYQALDTDLTAQIVRVRDSNPDALLIWATDPGATLLVKQAAALGFKKPVFNSPAVADPKFIAKAGPAAEGTYVQSSRLLVAADLPDSDPQKAGLVWLTRAYRKRFGEEPPQNSGHPYDALLLIEQGLKQLRSDGVGSLAKAMEKAKFCGANGCFQMSALDHNGLPPESMVILQARGGRWVLSQ